MSKILWKQLTYSVGEQTQILISLVSNTLAAFSEGLVLAKFPHGAGKKTF